MAFDIKAMVGKLVDKIQEDPTLLKEFQSNPIPVVEKLIGIDLPDDQIKQVAELVKAKIDMDKMGDLLGGVAGLFGKK